MLKYIKRVKRWWRSFRRATGETDLFLFERDDYEYQPGKSMLWRESDQDKLEEGVEDLTSSLNTKGARRAKRLPNGEWDMDAFKDAPTDA